MIPSEVLAPVGCENLHPSSLQIGWMYEDIQDALRCSCTYCQWVVSSMDKFRDVYDADPKKHANLLLWGDVLFLVDLTSGLAYRTRFFWSDGDIEDGGHGVWAEWQPTVPPALLMNHWGAYNCN